MLGLHFFFKMLLLVFFSLSKFTSLVHSLALGCAYVFHLMMQLSLLLFCFCFLLLKHNVSVYCFFFSKTRAHTHTYPQLKDLWAGEDLGGDSILSHNNEKWIKKLKTEINGKNPTEFSLNGWIVQVDSCCCLCCIWVIF